MIGVGPILRNQFIVYYSKYQLDGGAGLKVANIILALFVFTAAAVPAQDQLLDSKLRDLLHGELSGEIAKDHVIQITRHSRIQGSRQFRDSGKYVLGELLKSGFAQTEAYVESFKSDGIIHYQTWQSPSGFDMDWAELRMLEPFEERIVGYPEVAMSLITYSNPGNVTAELVFVGSGTTDADYAGKDVKGKIVLATGYGGIVHRLAVLKYGAKAVVCYLDDERAQQYPDMLAYTGMWPKTDELNKVTFGFNVTNRQGVKLRRLIESGKKVIVKAEAKGIGLEPYFMDVIVARIRGSEKPDEEIVFSAHLDHPKESANDNASGSAALLNIAETLQRLIDSGRMARPKRSLRFIWIPEWYGTMAYIDKHPELKGKDLGGGFLANLNMDMVGENLEILHSKLILTRSPDSTPSVLNDVIENMARMVDSMEIRTPRGSLSAMNYRITPYSGGSDHMMFIDREIPAVMFSHDPDYTHHTSEDTPDKVDPVELERSEILATGAALFLANLSDKDAGALVYLTLANSQGRLGQGFGKAHGLLVNATVSGGSTADMFAEAENLLSQIHRREHKTISTILHFNDGSDAVRAVESARAELNRQYHSLLSLLRKNAKSMGYQKAEFSLAPDKRIPVRLTRGPLDFGLPESKLAARDLDWYQQPGNRLSGSEKFEMVNFVDGNLSVSEIRNALSAEFGPISLERVARYFDDLVKVGVIAWKSAK